MSEDVVPLTVFVRVRPMNQKEKREANSESVQALTATNQIKCNGKLFAFDSVLGQDSTQNEVYDVTTRIILDKFVMGFNCTMLAYGQTGSGKTFTMGTEETTNSVKSDFRGIIPRLVSDLFVFISRQEYPEAYNVTVSMLEIYDEKIHDLLTDSTVREALQIREQNGEVFVKNLGQVAVDSLEKTMSQLEKGCQNRTKGETAMNAQSSRSHAIFTITLTKLQMTEEDTSYSSKLHLVDLAGSERAKKTMAEGERLREGIKINEGLLALGNVISILAEPGNNRHVPYRDTKITRLLQDSLGGNAVTVMIACVSPADSNSDETLSTLRYADRAKKIKNKPVLNVDPDKQIISQLREQVQELTKQLAQYRSGMVPDNLDKTDADRLHQPDRVIQLEHQLQDARSKQAAALFQQLTMARRNEQYEEERERIKSCPDVAQAILDILEAPSSEDLNEGDPSLDVDMDPTIENHEQAEEADRERFHHLENINNQLANLQSEIDLKERKMKQEEVNNENVEKLLSELESRQQEISDLQSERDKLNAELKKIGSSSKLAEERRRKVNDLEKQIVTMKKQVNEAKKLEKQKKDAEDIMKKMRAELVDLKKVKIKMTREARIENEKYRKWKSSMELQLTTLKRREERREVELAREKKAKDQQIVVMKSRLEEAQRAMKRLETQNKKITQVSESKGDTNTIKKMIEDLIAGYSTHFSLQRIAAELREERKTISKELATLRIEPCKKKRRTDTKNGIDESEIAKQEESLKASLDLINMELENARKSDASFNWDLAVENMLKCVTTSQRSNVKQILEMVKDERTSALEVSSSYETIKKNMKEVKQAMKEMKDESKAIKEAFRVDLIAACHENERFRNEYAEKYNQLVSLLASKESPDDTLLQTLSELGREITLETPLAPILAKKSFAREVVADVINEPRRTRCKKSMKGLDETRIDADDETFVYPAQENTLHSPKRASKRTKRSKVPLPTLNAPPSPIVNCDSVHPQASTTFIKDDDEENCNATFEVKNTSRSKSEVDIVPSILTSSPSKMNVTLGPLL